ncbi:MAG: histidine kinase [Daejeonella sp.]
MLILFLAYISREIHDNIGQALSLVSLNLNTNESPDTDKLDLTGGLQSMISGGLVKD